MKRLLVAIGIAGAGLISLVFILLAEPLLAAMRADRRARDANEDQPVHFATPCDHGSHEWCDPCDNPNHAGSELDS